MVQRTDITGSGLGRPGNGCCRKPNGAGARRIHVRDFDRIPPPRLVTASPIGPAHSCSTPDLTR